MGACLPTGRRCGWVESMSWLTWALLSALFGGLTAILAKIGVTGVDSSLATAVRTTVVLVFAWGVATGLSWLCYFHALKLGPASKVAPIHLWSP